MDGDHLTEDISVGSSRCPHTYNIKEVIGLVFGPSSASSIMFPMNRFASYGKSLLLLVSIL